MIKNIHILTIPHGEQRYPTVGDYVETSFGEWTVTVSDVGDWRMSMLIAFHELAELMQTENDAIPEPVIKAFDEKFEAANPPDDTEPGDQTDAPYHQQHVFAEIVERAMAQRLGINWDEYDKKLMAIWRRPKIVLNTCRVCGAPASVTGDKGAIVIACSQNRCLISSGDNLEEVSKIWNESQLKK
jgi:hypothetical protein